MRQLAKIMTELDKPSHIAIEEEMVAVVDAEDSRVQAETALDEAERALDIATALEDLHFVADTIKEATPREVALIQIVANTALAGTEIPTTTIAAEADATAESRTQKIKAVIERILAFIKELIDNVMDHVRDFVANIFSTLGNVQRRYRMVQDRIKEAEYSMDTKDKVSIAGFVLGNKFIGSAKELIPALKSYISTVKSFIKDSQRDANVRVVYYRDIFSQYDGSEEWIRSNLRETFNLFKYASPKPDSTPNSYMDGVVKDVGRKVLASDSLLGGYVLTYSHISLRERGYKEDEVTYQNLEQALSHGAQTGYRVLRDDTDSDVRRNAASAKLEVNCYNKDEIKQVMSLVGELVDLLGKDSGSLLAALEEETQRAKKAVEKITTTVAAYDPEMPGAVAMAGASKRAITHITYQATAPYNTLISNTLRLVNQVLVAVNRSLQHHEAVAKA